MIGHENIQYPKYWPVKVSEVWVTDPQPYETREAYRVWGILPDHSGHLLFVGKLSDCRYFAGVFAKINKVRAIKEHEAWRIPAAYAIGIPAGARFGKESTQCR